MRFVMNQKFLSWGDDYVIKDADGHDVYHVDGKVMTIGDKLSLQDLSGRELAFISQRLLAWRSTYNITVRGQLMATVSKNLFTLFKCRFQVDVPGPDDLEAEGDFFDHEYSFYRHGSPVASVSKRWLSWTDTYGIDISDDEDPILLLASAIVIDQICHDGKEHG
jgi:uncharacterized protein YxjI